MLIVDGHLDLAMNAIQNERDLLRTVQEIRAQEGPSNAERPGEATVGFSEMKRGRVALCFASLIARSTGQPAPGLDYASPAQAHGVARGQLAYYRALEREGHARVLLDRDGLDRHIAEWTAWDAAHPGDGTDQAPPLGLVVALEGADPILSPEQLPEWREQGVRVIGLTHYGPGRYAGGTGTESGLTDLGRRLLGLMAEEKMILDVSHCSDPSFDEAMDRFEGPVMASHSNCRALVNIQRQLNDEQLKRLIQRDSVIGVALYNGFLVPSPDQAAGEQAPPVTLSHVVDHIDHICQVAGDSRHAAIGSDLDGGFGREDCPNDLDTIADLQRLSGLLEQRGYGGDGIRNILGGNWLRLLRSAW